MNVVKDMQIGRRRVFAALLSIMFTLTWAVPSQAQLGLPLGDLIVNINSPNAGTTVSGTVAVRADVTIVGALTVRGVQFKLNGANLGSEDTSAPYSVSWNTNNVSNGSYTLTAVARDLLGLRYTSDPVTVTVSNDTTPPSVTVTSPSSGASVGGTITVSANASDSSGIAGVQFQLDGANLGSEDTSAPYSVSWNTNTASNGSHTLRAVARDTRGNQAVSSPVTVHVSNDAAPPTVSITSPASGATVSGTVSVSATASDDTGIAGVQFKLNGADLGAEDTSAPYTFSWDTTTVADGSHTLTAVARDTAGRTSNAAPVSVTVSNSSTTPPTTTRIEESDSSVSFTGGWASDSSSFDWSGGTASYSRGPDAMATVEFTGTRITWIGWREVRGGIARVYLDGAFVEEVDLYAAEAAIQEPVFTSDELAEGSHTLMIEVTGTANASATDTLVVVDAFEVTSSDSGTSSPSNGTATRVEETDSSIVYTGGWVSDNSYGPWSGGTAVYTTQAGAQAEFTFTGTGVDWIGYRGRYGGIVRVYLDGTLVDEIDTYSASEEVSVSVYSTTGLSSGSHTLLLELTGESNSAATNSEMAVDAFDVTP